MRDDTIRVLLADDHSAIRTGLTLMLTSTESGSEPGVAVADDSLARHRTRPIAVVGEAADGQAAISQARALRPDVVLMDLRMPGTDGISATSIIVEEGLADVLVLTTFDLDEYVFAALRAGAAGFLLKSVEPAALVEAVRRVAAGDGVVAPEITRRLLTAFAATPQPETKPAPDGRLDHLTERECDVLAALGRGLSNADLAAELFITEATAKTHVSRILAKLHCTSRMQAAIIARETGLVD